MNESQTQHVDQFEKFVERVIADAKTRPVVANVALFFQAYAALLSLSVVPAMAQGYNAMADFDAFAPNAAFSGMMAGAAITLLASLGLNVIATVGLYRMRRYGIYAVGISTVFGLAAMTFTGASSLIGVVLSAALFYFLWNERQKFA